MARRSTIVGTPDKSNVYLVCCTACNSSLNVESGVVVIQRHEKVWKDWTIWILNQLSPPVVKNISWKEEIRKSYEQVSNRCGTLQLSMLWMWLKRTFFLICAIRTMVNIGPSLLIRICKKLLSGSWESKVCHLFWCFSEYQGTSAEWSSRPAFYIPFWVNNK